MKLTKSEITKAIRAYARKHDLYIRTVRAVTIFRQAAIQEARDKKGAQ